MHFLTVVKKYTETDEGVDVKIHKCVVDTDVGSVGRMVTADNIDCYAVHFDASGAPSLSKIVAGNKPEPAQVTDEAGNTYL